MAPSAKPRRPELRLTVQYPAGKVAAPTRPQVRRWVRAACSKPAAVTVRFVGADEARSLNRNYRGKDYATNILSFPYESGVHFTGVSGDLVLCLPVVTTEANEQGKRLDAHFAHLIVHGMLHLQGYDHETSHDDAEHMEALERDILNALGYPDPYV
jgi:probable rRNA maturation factor